MNLDMWFLIYFSNQDIICLETLRWELNLLGEEDKKSNGRKTGHVIDYSNNFIYRFATEIYTDLAAFSA